MNHPGESVRLLWWVLWDSWTHLWVLTLVFPTARSWRLIVTSLVSGESSRTPVLPPTKNHTAISRRTYFTSHRPCELLEHSWNPSAFRRSDGTLSILVHRCRRAAVKSPTTIRDDAYGRVGVINVTAGRYVTSVTPMWCPWRHLKRHQERPGGTFRVTSVHGHRIIMCSRTS